MCLIIALEINHDGVICNDEYRRCFMTSPTPANLYIKANKIQAGDQSHITEKTVLELF